MNEQVIALQTLVETVHTRRRTMSKSARTELLKVKSTIATFASNFATLAESEGLKVEAHAQTVERAQSLSDVNVADIRACLDSAQRPVSRLLETIQDMQIPVHESIEGCREKRMVDAKKVEMVTIDSEKLMKEIQTLKEQIMTNEGSITEFFSEKENCMKLYNLQKQEAETRRGKRNAGIWWSILGFFFAFFSFGATGTIGIGAATYAGVNGTAMKKCEQAAEDAHQAAEENASKASELQERNIELETKQKAESGTHKALNQTLALKRRDVRCLGEVDGALYSMLKIVNAAWQTTQRFEVAIHDVRLAVQSLELLQSRPDDLSDLKQRNLHLLQVKLQTLADLLRWKGGASFDWCSMYALPGQQLSVLEYESRDTPVSTCYCDADDEEVDDDADYDLTA